MNITTPDYYDSSDNITVLIDTDFEWPTDAPPLELTTPYEWAAVVIYSLVFVLGVPGNALVLWITAFEMKRTVNTVWFLNLAVADLLCCLVVPFSIMEIVLHKQWLLGLFACKTLPSILLLNMYTSVLLLTLISIDRCALVIKPVWCQNKRTVRKAQVACAVVWMFALLLTSPSFIFRNTNTQGSKTKCSMVYGLLGEHHQNIQNFIAIFRLLMGFVVPLVVITTSYGVLMQKVSGRFSQSSKSLEVVLVVITGFFVCWFPYHMAGLILAVNEHTSALYKSTLMVDQVLISVAFINSCVNPIIYVLVGQNFKSKFKKSIKTVLRNVFAEESSQSFDSKKTVSTSQIRNTESMI